MDILELLGSKPRLQILRMLTYEDRYVSELMEHVGMDGKTATHHLKRLEEAGVVRSYREGRRRYYRLIVEVRLEIAPSPNRRFIARCVDLPDD